MFMRSSVAIISGVLAVVPVWAQADTHGSFRIDFPKDSPVTVVSPLSADWGQSRSLARGGATVLDLHTSLSLRNSGQRRIRGVTLMVLAQEVTPGGKASVSVPSLDIAAGETFPVHIDLRLLRPIQGGESPVVQVTLDGVLFDDLSFYGPNRLESRRAMTVWELEAQRDRRHFKSVLEASGMDGLQKEVLAGLGRNDSRSQPGVQMVRGGRATTYEPEHEMKFAFLEFPDAPIQPVSGVAKVAGNEARSPQIEVRNRGSKPVRYFELGWLVQDEQGRQFLAGSVPAELNLAPGQKTQVLQETALRFPERTGIKGMTGFVSSVEFADGHFWIPSRAQMAVGPLQSAIAPSGEEQRLIQIYRKRGLKALVEELRKF
jgi:hypothetical protein